MQIRLRTELTAEQYINAEQWGNAKFWPRELRPGAGFRRHGTYGRRKPNGLRVARWYNRDKHLTVSALPDFAAARVSSSLAEIEDIVADVEQASGEMSFEHIAGNLRRDIGLPGAMRWVRRRMLWVSVALTTLRGLAADKLTGCALSVEQFRLRLGTECVLARAREIATRNLARFPAPVGLSPLPKSGKRRRKSAQHKSGSDPPTFSP